MYWILMLSATRQPSPDQTENEMKDERVDEIFARLEDIDIELDYDPIERGPKFLNNMVASCRNYTTEVQRYMRECQMYRRTIERKLRTAEAEYELEYNHLMANDEEIIQMRALSRVDREALAKTKLRERVEEITALELALTDSGHVETVIDSKLRELRDINRDIRLQKRLIEDEISTGALWGNDQEHTNNHHIELEDIDTEDVASMFEQPPEEDKYDEFFVVDDEKELDIPDQTDTISGTSEDSGPTELEETFEDLDFDSALESLG